MESEQRYKLLVENASDLIQIVHVDGEIVYVNQSWLKTLGYNWPEIQGKPIFDFIKDSEKIAYEKHRQKQVQGNWVPQSLRTTYVTKSGEEIAVEGSATFVKQENQFHGIFRNITEELDQQKKIEFYLAQLSEKEDNLRNIIENAPDAVIVVDTAGRILLWNPKAEMLFGWHQHEVVGQPMSNIIIPEYLRGSHSAGMQHFHATRSGPIINKTIEVPALHKEGSEFYVSLTVSHSVQAGNDIFIGFLKDITEQRENRLELENKTRLLEKTNKELEQYAWLTSHDLKEPLRKILTYSDALIKKQGSSNDNPGIYLSKIHSSATRMSTLIDAVLQYSNVASEEALFEEVDLNKVIAGVLDDLELLIESKSATVEVAPLPTLQAIPIQMRQLLQNLVSNAIHYAQPGRLPIVNIDCLQQPDGYTLQFADNGTGFDMEYAPKIFQVFQRLNKDPQNRGTGIGLALCKKIVDVHQGTISVQSMPNEGSTFTVFLPRQHRST